MIEEIVIVKDGRLSLEAAIDIEDPEDSIKNYFNINFQGITTAKEMKKLEETNKKINTSHLISSKNIKDFDKVKYVLSDAVNKQAKFLFNLACEDTSILDKTTNDNINKKNSLDFLKNEPIKNEQGNYKYIKIIDIRKNENFGGLYMFMRRPSPLSLKVKSKFAELYLLPKKDAFSIANNYNNIWRKIQKKDFHNMLSIKHKTFNILNKYIEINGIRRINPNDMSRYIYAWEDPNKNNKLSDKSYSFFSKQVTNQNTINEIPNKSPVKKKISPNLSAINRNKNNNSINTKKSRGNTSPKSQSNQPIQTDIDFSNLLTLMTNGRQVRNNTNSNDKTHANNCNSEKNINNIKNKELNLDLNYLQEKSSSQLLSPNFFYENKKTNNSNEEGEEGKTIIMPKESGNLLPSTLNNIFNENRAEELKEQMQKSKKKEIFRKLLSFGKKTAELFANNKYSVILVDKKDELVELSNNNFLSSKSVIKDNEKLNDYLSLCQNNFFENIPEIRKEGVISFSFESIYQNINTITNMQYSKNKIYQEKTIKFLKKLTTKKDTFNNISRKDIKNSFSNSFSNNNESISLYSLSEKNNNISDKKSSRKLDLFKLFSDSDDSKENSDVKSEQLYKIKKQKKKNRNKDKRNEFTVGNSMISRADLATNMRIRELKSLEPKKSINIGSPKRISQKKKRITKNMKKNNKYTFKIGIFNDSSIINEKSESPISKKKRTFAFDKRKNRRMSEQKKSIIFSSEISNKNRPVKNSKTEKKRFLTIEKDINKKSHLTESKLSQSEKVSKGSSVVPKSEQYLNIDVEKSGIRNSRDYFAKEKKEDCKIQ